MSKLGLVIVLILMAGRTYTQDYFVLIEADNGQPFYVRVDSQLYSSSARGHLILSQLKDSSYIITIGFPGQVFPERQFSFNVHQNDHAFRLKNEDEKGWWLVDDKGQELAMVNGSNGGTSARIPGIKKDDAFSRLMADVVKDTAVMYSTYTIEQATSSPAAVASVSATQTPANAAPANDSQALTIGRSADTSVSTGRVTRDSSVMSVIRPARDSSALHSIDPTAAIRPADSTAAAGGSRDTSLAVHPAVALPVDSGVARSAAVPLTDTSLAARSGITPATDSAANHTVSTPLYRPIPRKDTATTAAPVVSTTSSTGVPLASTATPLYRTIGVTMLAEHRSTRSLRQVYTDHDSSGKTDTVVIIIPLDTPVQIGRPAVTSMIPRAAHMTDSGHLTAPQGHDRNPDTPVLSPARTSSKSALPFVNSDCHNFATDYDVDKLRVKMLESAKDDDRILAASKVFKTKCFSTRQIRALSEVFTTDAAKFKFLEAAYPFVSDDHFAELSNLLADPVYSGRFRAMTYHP